MCACVSLAAGPSAGAHALCKKGWHYTTCPTAAPTHLPTPHPTAPPTSKPKLSSAAVGVAADKDKTSAASSAKTVGARRGGNPGRAAQSRAQVLPPPTGAPSPSPTADTTCGRVRFRGLVEGQAGYECMGVYTRATTTGQYGHGYRHGGAAQQFQMHQGRHVLVLQPTPADRKRFLYYQQGEGGGGQWVISYAVGGAGFVYVNDDGLGPERVRGMWKVQGRRGWRPAPSVQVLLVASSPHPASPHLASPRLASPRLTSPHPASPHLTSPRLASSRLTSPRKPFILMHTGSGFVVSWCRGCLSGYSAPDARGVRGGRGGRGGWGGGLGCLRCWQRHAIPLQVTCTQGPAFHVASVLPVVVFVRGWSANAVSEGRRVHALER
jgi:hypothetical protein